MTTTLRLGLAEAPEHSIEVLGELRNLSDEPCYSIADYDGLEPFFTTVLSDCDLWMYASSTGSLVAGRGNPQQSLFPYETVDKIHARHAHVGPATLVRCIEGETQFLWRPFTSDGRQHYQIQRDLTKNLASDSLTFTETNLTLGLRFSYTWRASDRFGWVRTVEITNEGSAARCLSVLDGVLHLLPTQAPKLLLDTSSCLVDAYTRCELDTATKLALYTLSSRLTDRAEASEALLANVAWHCGIDGAHVMLGAEALQEFSQGIPLKEETDRKGRKGAYLAAFDFTLDAGAQRVWYLCLDAVRSQSDVAELQHQLAHPAQISEALLASLDAGREGLRQLLDRADAAQATGDTAASAHHLPNVLFNIARGGILSAGYAVDSSDLRDFVRVRNRPLYARTRAFWEELPATLPLPELQRLAEATADATLIRLCQEYLPLSFSRRHGDPSRPWNSFNIRVRKPDDSPLYAYEGNWRDIFQNWEALCFSFPSCLEPIIAKFVNASTVDGFNPYRITRDGIDWEVLEPDNPWSSIGYWGDHQIVYLLKLLEASTKFHPGLLEQYLIKDWFCYTDVPYDIKPYIDILRNPQDTIVFNQARAQRAADRVKSIGTDGRLLHIGEEVYRVNFAEKLLVPILAKLSNLVPGGGIWMNTQRPEWNDANNALVGNGLSMVTLCYLRRHLMFCESLFARAQVQALPLSKEVAEWLTALATLFGNPQWLGEVNDNQRRAFLDAAGNAFEQYRMKVYAHGFSGRIETPVTELRSFLAAALAVVVASLEANHRADGLFHAYNLLRLSPGTARITHLQEMLEGQVAILSSEQLDPEQTIQLLDTMRHSALYRPDQNSYLLYPARTLPRFMEKNVVPQSAADSCELLKRMLDAGQTSLVCRDANGTIRFRPEFHNAHALAATLDELRNDPQWGAMALESREAVLGVYEAVFNHNAFTGRSGSMYGYEGIGCIYWHMVAKLLLAVQDTFFRARSSQVAVASLCSLKRHYYDIRAGLGFTKSPLEFGAFPLDPYSHTPGFAGAQQPGMTGQVKEEILTRFGELGLRIEAGCIQFDPVLLRHEEFLTAPTLFSYRNTAGEKTELSLNPGTLAFTYCQVPILYQLGNPGMQVIYKDGQRQSLTGNALGAETSQSVFERTGVVERIEVGIDPAPRD